MEFDLPCTVLNGYQLILDTSLSQEEITESIVPDACPDVARIIQSVGSVYLSGKHVGEGSATVLGTVSVRVLYMPENDPTPRALNIDVPFQRIVDFPEFTGDTELHITMLSAGSDAQLINPRKLLVRVNINLGLHAYRQKKQGISHDITCSDQYALQKKIGSHTEHLISEVLEKTFSFSDVLHQSSSKPAMDEILSYHTMPGAAEAKYIGNKLVCKGDIKLSVVYRSEDKISSSDFELPFSQILETNCPYNEGEPYILVTLRKVDCSLQEGTAEVSIEAVIQAVLWAQHTVDLLHDVYSTTMLLDVERAACIMCSDIRVNSKHVHGRKFCESGIPAKQILNQHVYVGSLAASADRENREYSVDAYVDLLYLSEDDALCSVSYSVPLSCAVDIPEGYTCCCVCRPAGELTAVPVTGGFEIRLELEFSWCLTKDSTEHYVSRVEKSAAAPISAPRPSLVIRRVGEGDTLWEIAKSCFATVEDICTANAVKADSVEPGSVLLIPVCRCEEGKR